MTPKGDSPMAGYTKGEWERLIAALKSLVGGDVCYDGPNIIIRAMNHGDAVARVRFARAAIAKALGQ